MCKTSRDVATKGRKCGEAHSRVRTHDSDDSLVKTRFEKHHHEDLGLWGTRREVRGKKGRS